MRRFAAFLLLVVAGVAIGLALFHLVWFQRPGAPVIETRLLGRHAESFQVRLAGPYIWIAVVAGMAAAYYMVRIAVTAVTVLIGVPYSRPIAWASARSAYLQGAGVLACAIATLFVSPVLIVPYPELVVTDLDRAWGGYVLAPAVLLALAGTFLIARTPALAAIQGWELAESIDEPVGSRRERPLMRPRPGSVVAIDANPFRAGPQVDLGAKLVKTAKAPEPVKVVNDPQAAPPPKLLG